MNVTPPILIDVPERIETARLVLRPPRAGDGPDVNAAVLESLDALSPWMPWVHPVPTVEDSEAFARKAAAKFMAREDLQFRASLKDSDELVCSSGLHRIDWTVPRFEIGYWVRAKFAGQGYVTETVAALTQLAFERFDAKRVEIRCDDRNLRSARVAERLGFQLEGVLRSDSRAPDDSIRDTRVYSKIA